MLKKKEEIEIEKTVEEGAPKWLETYGDMITLLLTFFVFLFAFSTLDVQKFRQIVISLQGTLGVLNAGERIFDPGDLPQPNPSRGEPVPSYSLATPIPQPGEPQDIGEKEMEIEEKEGEIIVRIPGWVLFDEGKAELKEEGKEKLRKLAPVIQYFGNKVTVVGYADWKPVTKPKKLGSWEIKDNWMLSAARAVSVVDFLMNEFDIKEDRFVVEAKGKTDPLPVERFKRKFKENWYEEWLKYNRRIDIIFRPQPTTIRRKT
jgi:chemotaxis protein MotB